VSLASAACWGASISMPRALTFSKKASRMCSAPKKRVSAMSVKSLVSKRT
jgi:hypothetical protein